MLKIKHKHSEICQELGHTINQMRRLQNLTLEQAGWQCCLRPEKLEEMENGVPARLLNLPLNNLINIFEGLGMKIQFNFSPYPWGTKHITAQRADETTAHNQMTKEADDAQTRI